MGTEVEMATLLWKVETEGVGGNELLVTDIDGDGEVELLARQSPGQLRSKLNRDRGWNTDAERHIHCITAIDLKGNRLWQVGELNATEYLLQIQQRLDTRASGLRLQAQTWSSWTNWLVVSGDWQAGLSELGL